MAEAWVAFDNMAVCGKALPAAYGLHLLGIAWCIRIHPAVYLFLCSVSARNPSPSLPQSPIRAASIQIRAGIARHVPSPLPKTRQSISTHASHAPSSILDFFILLLLFSPTSTSETKHLPSISLAPEQVSMHHTPWPYLSVVTAGRPLRTGTHSLLRPRHSRFARGVHAHTCLTSCLVCSSSTP